VPKFINSPSDLITSHKATVEGFLKQALAKTEKATPYSEAATKFHQALQKVQDINTLNVLLDDLNYRSGLIAAAGFSLKAAAHLTKEELDDAIKKVFSTLKDKFGESFREEIVYRYLLTMGDTLGGSMRNYVGAEAGLKLTNVLIAALPVKEEVELKKSDKGKVQRISWDSRLLLFDVKTQLIGNNVDVILLDTLHAMTVKELVTIPHAYLACGELKGGIDPAGADEHWKTARSALVRIQTTFGRHGHQPALFFVGAAIEPRMAQEIYDDLQSGLLTHAANLTVPEQVEDLAAWLVAL
jgi:type II restriction enzyme